MQERDLHYTPVWQLRELLDSRQISSVELTEHFLNRIERLNPRFNAFLTVTGDEAMAAAREADRAIRELDNRAAPGPRRMACCWGYPFPSRTWRLPRA